MPMFLEETKTFGYMRRFEHIKPKCLYWFPNAIKKVKDKKSEIIFCGRNG
jgi:hypothetical protein